MKSRIPKAVVLATLAWAGAASAQSVWTPPDVFELGAPGANYTEIVLIVNPALDLEPVSVAEVLGGGTPARDAGAAAPSVSGAMVGLAPDPSVGFAFNQSVTRVTNHVFRAWVRNARGNLSDVQIQYDLVSPSGVPSRLEHPAHPDSYMPARAQPLGPWEILQNGSWRLIQAGGRFDMSLQRVTRAGSHEGTLVIVVNSL